MARFQALRAYGPPAQVINSYQGPPLFDTLRSQLVHDLQI